MSFYTADRILSTGSPSTSLVEFLRHAVFPTKQHKVVRLPIQDGFHEVNERMLHANFQLLVDYIECECAREELEENPSLHEATRKWHWAIHVRNPALGVLFLSRLVYRPTTTPVPPDEVITVFSDGEQEHLLEEAELAQGLLYLYDWWTNVRPIQLRIALATADGPKQEKLLQGVERDDQQHLEQLIYLRKKDWF